jgi:hypothetical protein
MSDDKIPGSDLPLELLASEQCLEGIGKTLKGGKADFTVTHASIRYMDEHALVVEWETVSAGFGEVTFYREGEQLFCETECMGPDFVKAVLAKLVDGCELR